MTSFIEIPQIGFEGRDVPSFYVNVADIIAFKSTYDDGTEFEIRQLGTDGMAVLRRTYLPIRVLIGALKDLAEEPGVVTWSEETRDMFRLPAQDRARAAAAAEREAARAGH